MFTGGAELEFEVYIRTQYIQIVVKSHCPSDAPVVNVPSPTLVFSIPLPCPSYRPLSQSLTLSLGYSPSEYLWIPSNKIEINAQRNFFSDGCEESHRETDGRTSTEGEVLRNRAEHLGPHVHLVQVQYHFDCVVAVHYFILAEPRRARRSLGRLVKD